MVTASSSRNPAIPRFVVALAVLVALRLALGKVAMPEALLALGNALTTLLFIALPVYAVFQVSKAAWRPAMAAGFVAGGVLVQAGGTLLAQGPLRGTDLPASFAIALAQAGLILWCSGLGAGVALLLKDKNLLIPISVFLVGFDVFLVFAPVGPTRMIMERAPEALPSVALQVPSVQATPGVGPVQSFAFVGPADLLFMAMFFVALHRFGMRSQQTAVWLVPTILVYLVLAFQLGAVPLLVPIGLCVLAVNAPEFKLTGEEKASTAVIGLISLALAISAFAMPRPPAEPETAGLSPEQRELAETPAQAPPSPPR
jgi:hypothetical protein